MKKTSVNARATFAVIVIPKMTISRGASARRGMAFAASRNGLMMRSRVGSSPRESPTATPTALARIHAITTAVIVARKFDEISPDCTAAVK
jgi:hypothetical protein